MQNPYDNSFQFLTEISKENTYHLLFPDSKAGFAVIWLYEKIQAGKFAHGTFKEKDIHDALRATSPLIESDKSRHPFEHYNAIISNLQEYFIRYDDERQEYSFKEYATLFCKQAHSILLASFSPTRIEKICISLYEKLNGTQDIHALQDWFKLDFDTFKPQLKSQLDFLDRQIDQSVISFRENKKLSLQEGAILEILRQIDDRFELIREQNKELRTAFRKIDQIKQLMNDHAIQYDDSNIDDMVHEAVIFFQEMRRTLTIIDKRLDRIQPKIRQLFINLNKPLFNARVDRFINHIVDHSKEIIKGNRSRTQFPGQIPAVVLLKIQQDLTIIERKTDLFPVKAKKRVVISESPLAKAKAFASSQNRLHQQDEISDWIDLIKKDMDSLKELNLSNYFFRIANPDEPNTLGLAIAVIYKCISFFEGTNQHLVNINPDKIIQNPQFKTSLWEIMITKKE